MKQTVYFFIASLSLLAACQSSDSTTEPADNQVATDTTYTVDDLIASLTRQLERSPDNWALYEERSRAFYAKGDVTLAINDIRGAINLFDSSPDLHYLRGFYAFAEGDTSLALAEYRLAAEYGSSDPDNFYQIGQIFFFRKQYPQALASYQEAIQLDSLSAIYPFAKGYLEHARGNLKKAQTHYEEALALDPTFEKALLQLHDLHLDGFKDETTAMTFNQRVLDRNPLHPLAQYNLGNFHYRRGVVAQRKGDVPTFQGAFNEAVQAYTFAINKGENASFAEPFFFRGYCYVMGERYDLALTDLQKAVKIDSTHAQAHFYLGSINENYGDLETALGHFERAVAASPDWADAQAAAAEVRKQLGR